MKHENLQHPPALAEGGELRGRTKAEILPCLYPDYKLTLNPESPNVTCLVVDGPALITIAHLGSQRLSKTTPDYAFFPKFLACCTILSD